MTVTTPTRSLPAGRWLVDGRGSQLDVTVRVGAWATVCGRFTEVLGHLDVGAEPGECAVVAEIATASLSSGSRYWDRVLAAAGLVDTTANPLLRYRSTSVHPDGARGWRVDGVLDTRGGAEPLAFALAGPATTSDGSARFRARGELPTTVAAALLGRAEAAALLGPTLALDLQVRARPPAS